jgi:hypothetical protein
LARRREFARLERLGQNIVHAGFQALRVAGGTRESRDRDDSRAPAARSTPNPPCWLITVDLRHLAVHQHEVVRETKPHLHRFSAVVRNVRTDAVLLEHAYREPLVHLVVLREQHAAL